MRGEVEEIRPRRDNESLVEYYLSETNDSVDHPETQKGYRTAWNTYTSWLEDNNYHIGEIRVEEAEEFRDYLIEKLNGGGPQLYFSRVKKTVEWLTNTEQATHNPFDKIDEPDYTRDSSKMEVGLDNLRAAVLDARSQSIELFVYIVMALKTGLRAAEIVNLDLRDIHLDHPISDEMPDPRTEIYNYPDALYVDSDIDKERAHNGEERRNGNKKNSHREVPIDKELKQVLVWWIAMLPPSDSPAKPLLRQITDPDGERFLKATMQQKTTDWARRNDLNSVTMKHFGVDSHWCRHWFSTLLQARIDDEEVIVGSAKGYVEGLRGDSEDSTIDTYTHEWEQLREEDNKSYREVYEDNIPKLFTGESRSDP